MSWTDEDIDRLFEDAGNDLSFEYKPAYWNEVEAMLPQQKKRDVLWFITAFGSIGVLLLGFVYSTSQLNHYQLSKHQQEMDLRIAEQEKSNLVSQNTVASLSGKKGALAALLGGEDRKTSLKGAGIKLELIGAPFFIGNWDGMDYYMQQPFCNQVYQMPYGSNDGLNFIANGNEADEKIVLATTPLTSDIDKSLASISTSELGKFPARVSLYFEANAGLSQSLITPSNQLFARYGGGVGINIHTNKWTTTIGVNGSVSNHNDIALSRVAKYYSYGSQVVTHNLNYKSLYAIEGVLALTRNFGRHGVTVGIRPSYLMSTKVDYTRIDEKEQVAQRNELIGFTDGINRFGLKPTFGYSFMLNEKWNTGINLGVQTMETFKEDFITKDNNRFPIDGQIYIRRNIQLRK